MPRCRDDLGGSKVLPKGTCGVCNPDLRCPIKPVYAPISGGSGAGCAAPDTNSPRGGFWSFGAGFRAEGGDANKPSDGSGEHGQPRTVRAGRGW